MLRTSEVQAWHVENGDRISFRRALEVLVAGGHQTDEVPIGRFRSKSDGIRLGVCRLGEAFREGLAKEIRAEVIDVGDAAESPGKLRRAICVQFFAGLVDAAYAIVAIKYAEVVRIKKRGLG